MNMNDLAVLLSQKEKGKSEVNIAQIKELLAHLSDLLYSSHNSEIITTLYENGQRRAFGKSYPVRSSSEL